jgi:hypothetical protein
MVWKHGKWPNGKYPLDGRIILRLALRKMGCDAKLLKITVVRVVMTCHNLEECTSSMIGKSQPAGNHKVEDSYLHSHCKKPNFTQSELTVCMIQYWNFVDVAMNH